VELPAEEELGAAAVLGCKFADRCPHVMAICRQTRPTLAQVGPNQHAACHLF
jgi:oligopeptide/dipeptide ABC transporter ATP-binding protein